MKYRIMTVSVQSAVIISGYRRIERAEMIADEGSFEEWDEDLVGNNPLHYAGYTEKQKMLQEKTGLKEAVITGKADWWNRNSTRCL